MAKDCNESKDEEDLPLVLTISLQDEWFSDIAYYLTYGECPKHLSGKKKINLKMKVERYVIWEDTLYKRGLDGAFLKCVDKSQHERLLGIFHNEACGGHFSSTVTALKILRHGYYWPCMFKDAYY